MSTIIESSKCGLYLAPSKIQGIGVFAGKTYEKGSYTNLDPVVTLEYIFDDLDTKLETKWQLGNYLNTVYRKAVVSFGPSMMYNHDDAPHVHMDYASVLNTYQTFLLRYAVMVGLGALAYFGLLDRNIQPQKVLVFAAIFYAAIFVYPFPGLIAMNQNNVGYTLGPSIGFTVIAPIPAGSEVFYSYGSAYFTARNITVKHMNHSEMTYSLDELEEVGVCLSHTYIGPSEIPSAGQGVFSAVDVPKGGLVTVTPALIHHREMVMATQSLLINYLVVSSKSNVTLLPYGAIGMVNHGGAEANAKMEWFFWDGDDSALKKSPEQLFASQATQVFLAYRAIKDIHQGEEITIDYGDKWEEQWETFHVKKSIKMLRASIEAPVDLFPDHWKL